MGLQCTDGCFCGDGGLTVSNRVDASDEDVREVREEREEFNGVEKSIGDRGSEEVILTMCV